MKIESNYRPKQSVKTMKPEELGKYKNFELKGIDRNKFITNNDHIDLTIPVPTNDFEILDVIDVSNNSINAIIVLMTGNNGNPTTEIQATHFVISKPKISLITGLRKSDLQKDKKLVIYLINDDNFNQNSVDSVKICVNNLGTTYPNTVPICLLLVSPNEIKGDIISGR